MTPEAQVGKIANLVIFLGIFSTVLTLVGMVRGRASMAGWAGLVALTVSLGGIGVGYGIRYGSAVCLYIATGLCVILIGWFATLTIAAPSWRPALRLLFDVWLLWRLGRAIPAMHVLHQNNSKPLNTSRYGEFFLRRKAHEE